MHITICMYIHGYIYKLCYLCHSVLHICVCGYIPCNSIHLDPDQSQEDYIKTDSPEASSSDGK